MNPERRCIFVTGGTGYLGRPLIQRLLAAGHQVRALVRPGSEQKLPNGCEAVLGNALDGNSYADRIQPADTFVQMVGVAHPSPAKANEFRSIDLASGLGAVQAAASACVKHFIYMSVAHPAPMMKAYIAVRSECESAIRQSGLNTTILRPWYVLGPGRRWPLLLVPMYWILSLIPNTKESTRRLGLLTIDEMIAALVAAIEQPADGFRVWAVPEIRSAKRLGKL